MKVFLPTLIVVCLDQLSKLWIKYSFSIYESRNILGDFLRFTYVENPGIAFGIRIGGFKIIVTIISAFIASYIAYLLYSNKSHDYIENFSLSLILGGAIGNLIDRIMFYLPNSTYTGVIDFIDIGLFGYRWFIFNIADSAVTIGIIIYLIFNTLNEYKNKINNA